MPTRTVAQANSCYGNRLFGWPLRRRSRHGGNHVTYIARAQLETILNEGPKLDVEALGRILTPAGRGKLPADSVTVQVKVTDKPAEVGSMDLLLFCVKAYDLEKAAEQARPLVGPHTTVLPL